MAAPVGCQHKDKRVMPNPEKAIEAMATRFVETGKLGVRIDPKLGAPSRDDAMAVQRISGMAVEQFNARLADRLQVLADKTANRIEEKLDQDAHKPGELAFLLSVLEDKRARLTGQHSLQNAQINVQVNNFGETRSRSEILENLFGKRAEPVNVTDVI